MLRIPWVLSTILVIAASTGALEAADWRIRNEATEVWITSRHKALGTVRVVIKGGGGTLSLDAKDVAATGLTATVPTSKARLVTPSDRKLSSAIALMSRQVPQVRFASRSVRSLGGGRYAVQGDMAMGSISRPATLTLSMGPVKKAKGRMTRSLRAAGTLRVSELVHGGVGMVERALAFMFHDEIQLGIETVVER